MRGWPGGYCFYRLSRNDLSSKIILSGSTAMLGVEQLSSGVIAVHLPSTLLFYDGSWTQVEGEWPASAILSDGILCASRLGQVELLAPGSRQAFERPVLPDEVRLEKFRYAEGRAFGLFSRGYLGIWDVALGLLETVGVIGKAV